MLWKLNVCPLKINQLISIFVTLISTELIATNQVDKPNSRKQRKKTIHQNLLAKPLSPRIPLQHHATPPSPSLRVSLSSLLRSLSSKTLHFSSKTLHLSSKTFLSASQVISLTSFPTRRLNFSNSCLNSRTSRPDSAALALASWYCAEV